MVPVRLIIKGWRKGVSRLDAYTVDQNDPEEREAYEKRKKMKHGVQKAPFVLANIFKKIFSGSKKGKQPKQEQQQQQRQQQQYEEPDIAPDAVPYSGGAAPVHYSGTPAAHGYAVV